MHDYYSYAPLLTLPRPLILCGIPGAEVGHTARVATMFTGLPLVRLTDRVSHLVGETHTRALITQGEQKLLDLELDQLEKALAMRSPPVIAITSVGLTDRRIRDLAKSAGDLVQLRLNFRVALDRIRADAADNPGKHLHLRNGGVADDEAILARLRFLDRLCREAPAHIDVGRRLPLDVGRQISDDLEARAAG
jgi:shikimate kinase